MVDAIGSVVVLLDVARGLGLGNEELETNDWKL
jgi:hypothetical protein